MFFKHSNDGERAILIVYVDDIIMTGDDRGEIDELKRKLANEFEVKDLGPLKYFLGMQFAKSKEGIFSTNISMSWIYSMKQECLGVR